MLICCLCYTSGAGRRGRHGVPEARAQAGQRSAAAGAPGLCTVPPPKLVSRCASIWPACPSRPSANALPGDICTCVGRCAYQFYCSFNKPALRLPILPGSRCALPCCAAHCITAARPPSQRCISTPQAVIAARAASLSAPAWLFVDILNAYAMHHAAGNPDITPGVLQVRCSNPVPTVSVALVQAPLTPTPAVLL